jgi:hypothetical protein
MIINPLVVQVRENNPDVILPVDPTMHGGSVGRVIGMVAMVVVPLAAPAIATAIQASGALGAAISSAMTTTIGGAISSAVVGAAIGGIGATIAGQPFSAGALTGAIAGGIGGYAQGVGPTGAEQVAGGVPSTTAPATAGAGLDTGIATSYDAAGNVIGTQSISSTGVVGASQASQLSLAETLRQTSQQVVSKLKSPENLANITMQAYSSIVGDVMVPEGTLAQLSPEEQALIEERKTELIALRDRDLEAYNQAIEISKAYMVQAGQVDPTYFAQQEANKSKIASARTIKDAEERASLNNMNFTDADARRAGLTANKLASSRFDEGFIRGSEIKDNLIDRGLQAMPAASSTVGYSQGLEGLQQVYAGQRTAADKERENIQMTAAGLNTITGNTDEDNKRKAGLYADGYNDALSRMGVG